MTDFKEHLRTSMPKPRRICYVGELAPDSTSDYRTKALERLGQSVDTFNVRSFRFRNPKLQAIRMRYPVGPLVALVNRELVKTIRSTRPDIVIFDKPIYFQPDTISAIKDLGAKIVFYVQDNPFGPRNDGCWMQFMRIYKMADLHCTFRSADIKRFTEWKLPFVSILLSYEPSIHFPPPDTWNDSNRDRGVSYIGSPYENRPQFLIDLFERFSLPVAISGERWQKKLTEAHSKQLLTSGMLPGKAYREGIWKSKINLSFVTELNEEDIGHKSVEIAASGGFLLALRTPGHQACFEEDREAVFFSSLEECAEKAAYYLSHESERSEIARRGYLRAVQSGYSNDTQLARMLNDPRL